MRSSSLLLLLLPALAIAQQDDTVTMIFTGFYDYQGETASSLIDTVELFGCGDGTTSQFVANFPYGTYLTAAVYMEDQDQVRRNGYLNLFEFIFGHCNAKNMNLCFIEGEKNKRLMAGLS